MAFSVINIVIILTFVQNDVETSIITESAKIINANGTSRDKFGSSSHSIAVTRDILVVGSSGSKSVFLYEIQKGKVLQLGTEIKPSVNERYYGRKVVANKNFFIVWATERFYIYDARSPYRLLNIVKVGRRGPAVADTFGYSVDQQDRRIYIGSQDRARKDKGAVFVFDISQSL